jgi:dihydrofolate reductase
VARLIYTAITSLDGYVADRDGNFDWSAPEGEVHAVVNDVSRAIGTLLLGRRMYEALVAWETIDVDAEPPEMKDFAGIWRSADKIVYSRTLDAPSSERTRIEREFDPDAVRELKGSSPQDLGIGGPELAAHAIRAGLVDEYHQFLNPIVVGGGKRALPDDVHWELELRSERRFANGVVRLHYRSRT